MILFDDVSDDYGIHDGWNPMKITWNSDKMTRIVQKTLRRINIAAVKWTPMIILFIGTNKTKWDKVKSTTHIRRRWENILTKYPVLLVKQGKPLRPSKHGTILLQLTFLTTFFKT
jgi:hypothetical protein